MTAQGSAPTFPPPRAWVLGAVGTLAMAAILTAAALIAGTAGVVPAVLGVIGMLASATRGQSVAWRTAMVALLAGSAALAVAVGPDPLLVPLIVAATALAGAVFTARFGAVALAAPVVPAIAGTVGGGAGPLATALLVAGGAVAIVVVVRLLGITTPGNPVDPRVAWAHAIILAIMAGATSAVVMWSGLGHGYWVVVGLCMVLSPAHRQARAETSVRIVGTAIGAAAAMALALVLPMWLVLPIAGLSLVAGLAYSAIGRRTWVIACQTVTIVTATAAIVPGETWEVAAARFAAIGVGAVLAFVAAELLVASVERRVQRAELPGR